MRIVSGEQVIIPPVPGQRPVTLHARRATDMVVPAPHASQSDEPAADTRPRRGRLIDILV